MEINHACEVDEIFDAISYRKGASVIRMLQSYLGAEPFQVRPLIFLQLPLLKHLSCFSSLLHLSRINYQDLCTSYIKRVEIISLES